MSLPKDANEWMKNMGHNLSTCLILVSKGRCWLDVKEDSCKFTGLTEKDCEMAGIIQLMFDVNSKKMDTEKIQKALDYFGWDLKLVREGDKVSFEGKDSFLPVQIGYHMNWEDMGEETYAKFYRDALSKGKVCV